MTSNTDNKAMELMPCPFCGGSAVFDYDDAGWNWIVCKGCGSCTDCRASCGEDCKPLLAEQWNRRAHIEAMQRDCRTCVYFNIDVNRFTKAVAFKCGVSDCTNHDKYQPMLEFKPLTRSEA